MQGRSSKKDLGSHPLLWHCHHQPSKAISGRSTAIYKVTNVFPLERKDRYLPMSRFTLLVAALVLCGQWQLSADEVTPQDAGHPLLQKAAELVGKDVQVTGSYVWETGPERGRYLVLHVDELNEDSSTYTRMTVKGQLEVSIVGPGGEAPDALILAGDHTWGLYFSSAEQRRTAGQLAIAGKTAVVSGDYTLIGGVETGLHPGIQVTDICAADTPGINSEFVGELRVRHLGFYRPGAESVVATLVESDRRWGLDLSLNQVELETQAKQLAGKTARVIGSYDANRGLVRVERFEALDGNQHTVTGRLEARAILGGEGSGFYVNTGTQRIELKLR
jgi:hypothetical protein